MRAGSSQGRISELWQLPLFVASLGLFVYSAYLLISPGPGATIDEQIGVARNYLRLGRPEAALEQLNKILDTEKVERPKDAEIHLLIGQALEAGQTRLHIAVPANYQRIIEQTQVALGEGMKDDADIHCRLGDSFAALGHDAEAIQHYRLAMALDATRSPSLQRKVIELQIDSQDYGAADVSLKDYLKDAGLAESERAWALGEKSQLLIDQQRYADAASCLADALKLTSDPAEQGRLNYMLGYSHWKLDDSQQAERELRLAREQLKPTHPLDGDACYVLGRIYQDRQDPRTANAFYEVVIVSHPDAEVAPLAILGRGICRIMQQQFDAGLSDLMRLTDEMRRRPADDKVRLQAVAGLQRASALLVAAGNYQGALESMGDEQSLTEQLPGSFFARLGTLLEQRSDQLESAAADGTSSQQVRRQRDVRDLRIKAGDAFIAYSRAMTVADDKGYGEALWKGIDLYDKAGSVENAVAALETFTDERPDDPLTPDALLRLGRAYQASGLFDKAISTFQRNRLRYPQSIAASQSAVPLAQAYIAKGPENFGKAENVLLSVLEDNRLVTPAAVEFRESLFELAQLYYRTGRFEEAINRLEEMTQRYPQDERMPRLVFLMADSYRKSAGLLDAQVASASSGGGTASDVAQAAAERRTRLGKAREMYDKCIDLYQSPATDLDRLYFKLAHFYRADCVYDLGSYDEAIRLYETAAFRFQDDASSLAAYVQIVNAYCAMGKITEAKTANERAKWLLSRMPADAFKDGSFSVPKEYWEQWLNWTSNSGLW